MTAYGWRSMAGGFAAMLAVMPNAAAQTPTTPAPAREIRQDSPGAHELTIDSPVRDIVALPGGKAIIDRIIPNFTLHPLFDQLEGMSLRQLQPFMQGMLNDEMLTKVAEELASGGATRDVSVLTVDSCTALAGMKVSVEQIGLPTKGAAITKAWMVPAGVVGPGSATFCFIRGNIAPVDPAAWDIEFGLALPISWNKRALLLGGGGFDGFIPDVTGHLATTEGATSPLARGYAVFGSDGGHKMTGPPLALDGNFALNREALDNWLGDALKKTRDVSFAIIEQAYGKRPERAYVAGGSGGGREALQAIARWSQDWDGAITIYPGRNMTRIALQAMFATKILAAPGAYPSLEKRALLHRSVLERCDGLDGAKDGMIYKVDQCMAVFDPATAKVDGAPLRCRDGTDAGPTCLSDIELTALKKINQRHRLPYALASGDTSLPGFNVYTSDLGRPVTQPIQGAVNHFAFGTKQPALPASDGMPMLTVAADSSVRYLIAQDPAFDAMTFDVNNPGHYAKRLHELSELESSDLNLSAFAKRGGKILILHGTDDLVVSPIATRDYYTQLQSKLGKRATKDMIRYYEVPGYAHTTSSTFNVRWDPWSAMEDWAEQGIDPADKLVIADATGIKGRSRPLCEYPKWAKYVGGDVNRASSFVCATD